MKYLLSALLLCGAFFSFPVSAQQSGLKCPDGGTLTEYGGQQICSVPAPIGEQYAACHNGYCVNTTNIAEGAAAVAEYRTSQHVSHCGSVGVYSYVSHTPDKKIQFSVYRTAYDKLADGSCRMKTGYPSTSTAAGNWALLGSSAYCPPDNSPALINLGGDAPNHFCWALAVDEEPPPDCENDPLNPCEPPPCVRGGNGMMVCKDNPEDKCWVDEWGHTQCEEGCGFVGETFFCATQPDPDEMPNFDKCKFTFNGYACPSEPDDDVPEPDKPLPDMKKQDFKDVNIGVETRQDVTNDLLETLISTNISESENLSKTLGDKLDEGNAGLGQANAYLKQIDINTNAMAEDIADFTDLVEVEPLPPEPESWYESEYEDGLKGIWEEKQPLLMATPLFSFVDQFNINPNGNPPDFEMCFNLGAMGNYGCDSFEVPQWIWNAIKVFILFTAAILCRAAVTGV